MLIQTMQILTNCAGAFFVTLGSRYGMRQMVLTRYSFGMIGTVIPAVANAIICLGWACINLILAGQLLSSVSEGKLPNYAGILLVAGCTLIVSLFGYHFVHKFERFAWLPLWVVFFCMLGVGAKSMSVPPIPSSDATEAGNFLSFAAAVIGYNPGWATCSADYSVKQVKLYTMEIKGGCSRKTIGSWSILTHSYPLCSRPTRTVERCSSLPSLARLFRVCYFKH